MVLLRAPVALALLNKAGSGDGPSDRDRIASQWTGVAFLGLTWCNGSKHVFYIPVSEEEELLRISLDFFEIPASVERPPKVGLCLSFCSFLFLFADQP